MPSLKQRLLLAILIISLTPSWHQVKTVDGSHQQLLSVWSDDYRSHAVVDPTLSPSQNFQVDINITDLGPINGYDITLAYDPNIVRVPSSLRLVYDANGEDTVVSFTPVREPTLAERLDVLTDFDLSNSGMGSFPAVSFIDVDGDGRYLIGETLVLDNDNSSVVDSLDLVVSETPVRPPSGSEVGRSLTFNSMVRFNDTLVNAIYDPGVDLLVFDHNNDGMISKPVVAGGTPAPTCHFWEGCLFDNTAGTPLEGRTVTLLTKSCDTGCTGISPGAVRLAIVLLGRPLVAGAGTLFQTFFRVENIGQTNITIQESTVTTVSPDGLSARNLPHLRRDGLFSNKPTTHEVEVVSLDAVPEKAVVGGKVNITVVVANFGTEDETAMLQVQANNTSLRPDQTMSLIRGSSAPVKFEWDTTSSTVGNYILNATLLLASDDFQKDNSLTIHVTLVRKNLAIQDFSLSSTAAPSGNIINTTATIANLGSETETFNLTISYENGEITRVPMTLTQSETRLVLFEWNTTNVPQGIFTVAATLPVLQGETDSADNQRSQMITFQGTNSPPRGSFAFVPLIPVAGEVVTFSPSNVQDPDNSDSIVTYAWDFGDAGTGSGAVVSHSYQNYGTFTITLRVLDSRGLWGRIVQTITVNPPRLSVTPTADSTRGEPPLIVSFSAQITGGVPPYAGYWDFGDGQFADSINSGHTYNVCGALTAELWVQDYRGNTSTETLAIILTTSQEFLVLDLASRPLNDVTITMVSTPTGQQQLTDTTGSNGKALFREILPGNYTFKLTKAGFQQSEIISVTLCRVQNSQTTALFPEPITGDNRVSELIPYLAIGLSALAVLGTATFLRRRQHPRTVGPKPSKRPKRGRALFTTES